MKSRKLFLVPFFICCLIINIQANNSSNSFSFDIGESNDNIKIFRLSSQKSIDTWLENKNIPFTGYLESSLNYWNGLKSDIYGLSFSPVLTHYFYNSSKYDPYIMAGIGAAFISNKSIDDRDLSSLFHLESRIGLGVEIDNINTYIKYMHYSNSGTSKPNDGIDIFLIGVTIKF